MISNSPDISDENQNAVNDAEVPQSCSVAWMRYFEEEDLVNGTSGNVIDDMQHAFDAGWRAARSLSDEQLLNLAERFCDACRPIVGFIYEPDHVIRDLRKTHDQVIWREKATESQAYQDQLKIEYMRYALEGLS